MDDVMTIARSTAGRILHLKALYFLLAMCIVIIASGQLYGDLTAGQEKAFSLDLGLAVVGIVGLLSALVGCFDLPRELREKTAQTILSKPLGRDRYLLGKFLGVAWICLVNMAIVGTGLVLLTIASGGYRPTIEIVKSIVLLYGAALQLCALGVLAGLLLREGLAAVLTVVIFWISYALGGMICHIRATGAFGSIAKIIYYLLPNFYLMDVKGEVVRGITVEGGYIVSGLALAVLYAAGLIILGGIVLRQKDIA